MERQSSEGAQDGLNARQLTGLRSFRAEAPDGTVLFIPRVQRFGESVVWETRVHKRGVIGPLRANQETLRSIGAPEDWQFKVRAFQEALQARYPALELEFGPDVEQLDSGQMKELDDGTPDAV